MTHTCLSCDARVEVATQTLEAAGGGRYVHTDWRDCQTALVWTRATTMYGFALTKTAEVRAAHRAAALDACDDVPASPNGVTVDRRW